jgi:hypothetical protein
MIHGHGQFIFNMIAQSINIVSTKVVVVQQPKCQLAILSLLMLTYEHPTIMVTAHLCQFGPNCFVVSLVVLSQNHWNSNNICNLGAQPIISALFNSQPPIGACPGTVSFRTT